GPSKTNACFTKENPELSATDRRRFLNDQAPLVHRAISTVAGHCPQFMIFPSLIHLLVIVHRRSIFTGMPTLSQM
ncbi:MAG: hypothetical protein OXC66_13705, partial [Roseovarius sp.]|nr:hypothetical protein [Roseovarius sp.]